MIQNLLVSAPPGRQNVPPEKRSLNQMKLYLKLIFGKKKKRLYDFGGVVEASYSSWNNIVFTG